MIHPHDIDASWLQRRISKYYVNPTVVQNKAAKVLDILKNATGDRDVEKKLVTLLDYECYDLIIVLKKYRNMILYCMLLANAQSESERAKIVKIMESDPELKKILESLLQKQ